jgi:cellulose synthase (UDP-forming)
MANEYNVAILIPAAGESIDIVRATAAAAMRANYERCEVFILDDSPDEIYRKLSYEVDCSYIRRKNRGEHKKAGNLNNAIRLIQEFDYYLVLDADFVINPEILNEMLPYAAGDVGIIQTPQHFEISDSVYKRSKVEYGAAYIQQDFYRITQVARNRYGAAICVGTNALYSKAALKLVGGYEGVGRADWGHSEDVNTGLKIINSRNANGEKYRIVYLPIQLAEGYCPENHMSFYKQQNRWCTGSMQLLFSRKTMFSKNLSIFQKICYASNSLYYFYTIGIVFTPLFLLVLALSDNPHGDWKYTMLFIPMLITNYIIGPYILRKKHKPFAVSLVVLSNAYTFVQALWLLFIRRPLGWEATGLGGQAKKSSHFSQYKTLICALFALLYITTLFVVIINDKLIIGASIFLVSLFISSLVTHYVFLYYVLVINRAKKSILKTRSAFAFMILSASLALTVFTGILYSSRYDIAIDSDRYLYLRAENK